MKRYLFLLVSSVFLSMSNNTFAYQKTDFGTKLKVDSVEIEIQFFNESTVRILKAPAGNIFDKKPFSGSNSTKVNLNVKQTGDILLLKSRNVQVFVNLKNGKVSFQNSKSELLLTEKENSTVFIPFNDAGVNTYSVSQSFLLDRDEAIYGLGQQQQGKMIQRNIRLHMIQGNTDDYIPFFLSVKGYGLFWDNYSPTTFIDNQEETFFNSEVGDCIDYYFMCGDNADGVISQMRNLTGQDTMFLMVLVTGKVRKI